MTDVDATVTSSVVNGYGFDITSVTFDGVPFVGAGSPFGASTADFFSYSAGGIGAGTHSITVFGTSLGSTYHGNVVLPGTSVVLLIPVPEPETYALMLAGLSYFPQVGRRICAQFPGCGAAV